MDDLSSQDSQSISMNEEVYTEKESQIIAHLLHNARNEAVKKISIQSSWSSESREGSIGDYQAKKVSKLQRIKNVFRINRKTSSVKSDIASPASSCGITSRIPSSAPAVPRFSYDNSLHDNCQDQFCFCDAYDDKISSNGDDSLDYLARDVRTKRKSFLKKLFGISNKNPKSSVISSEGTSRIRTHTEPCGKIDRRRSASTRSLPESLRHLWLWARSHSVENLKAQSHDKPTSQKPPSMNFKRSGSSYSMYHCQICSQTSNDFAKSSSCLPCEIGSPVSPFRRSKSLRSLSGNFDIATRLLQTRNTDPERPENNNLFYENFRLFKHSHVIHRWKQNFMLIKKVKRTICLKCTYKDLLGSLWTFWILFCF